jgi:hypothetical protein
MPGRVGGERNHLGLALLTTPHELYASAMGFCWTGV